MWRPLIDKLKEHFTIIAPNLPGIGDSQIHKNGCDMKTAATRVHALASSLGVTTARVVGHDSGLMVAYAYAAAAQRRVLAAGVVQNAWWFSGVRFNASRTTSSALRQSS